MRLFTLVLLLASAYSANACSCGTPTVAEAKKWADVVFRGTITKIENRTVYFLVDRRWKGKVNRTFAMPEFRESIACLGFWPDLLAVGNDLLVFADWLPPGSKDGAYFTSICTRTGLAKNAREELRRLGKGERPRE